MYGVVDFESILSGTPKLDENAKENKPILEILKKLEEIDSKIQELEKQK